MNRLLRYLRWRTIRKEIKALRTLAIELGEQRINLITKLNEAERTASAWAWYVKNNVWSIYGLRHERESRVAYGHLLEEQSILQIRFSAACEDLKRAEAELQKYA